MKKIILLLALFPLFVFAQFPQTDLDFRWTKGYDIIGSDTCLTDSLTGSGDTRFKLTNLSATDLVNLDSGYIKTVSNITAIFLSDTMKITNFFQNYNYADTLFYNKIDTSLNDVAYYSSNKTGSDSVYLWNYFNVPAYPSNVVIVPDDYSTIATGEANCSPGDVLMIKDGYYDENPTVNVAITVLCVGDVTLDGGAAFALTLNSSSGIPVQGMKVVGTSYAFYLLGTGNHSLLNNYNNTTNFCVNSGANGATYTINDNVTNGIINVRNTLNATRNYSTPAVGSYVYRFDGNGAYSYALDGNYIAANTAAAIGYCYNGFDVVSTNNTYFLGINFGTIGNDYFSWDSDGDTYSGLFSLKAGDGDINIRNGTIDYEALTGWTMDVEDQNSFSLTNMEIPQARQSIYVYATDTAYNVIIDSCNFNSDYNKGFLLDNINLLFRDNYMNGDSGVSLSLTADDLDVLKPQFLRNEFHNKMGASPMLQVNELTASPKYYLDSMIVSGNLFVGQMYYGQPDNGAHGTFFLTIRNALIENNKFIGIPIGSVSKAQGQSMKGTVYKNNLFIECPIGTTIRGASGISLINNTYVNDTLTNPSTNISLSTHESIHPSLADTTTIKNNIFINTNGLRNINSDSVGNLTNSPIDYNIYYGPTNLAYIQGVYYNLSSWQSTFSKDGNSFNSNPNLSSGYWPVMPSNAIGTGTFLGNDYRYGLNINSTWPDGIILEAHKIKVTMGAYVISKNYLLKYNNSLIQYNGKAIVY